MSGIGKGWPDGVDYLRMFPNLKNKPLNGCVPRIRINGQIRIRGQIPDEPTHSRHHLFSKPEIRAKLIEVFGEPKTPEEHRFIDEETMRVWKKMPKYLIDHQHHKRIHGQE